MIVLEYLMLLSKRTSDLPVTIEESQKSHLKRDGFISLEWWGYLNSNPPGCKAGALIN